MSAEPAVSTAVSLIEERDHLLRSIEDLDREHEAGEVGDPDYERLRAGYVARAAAVLRAIDEAAADPVPPAAQARQSTLRRVLGRQRTRVVFGIVLAVCVMGLVVLFALHVAGVRLPGEIASGGVSLGSAQQVRQQLQQAQQLGAAGDVKDALALYQDILASQPRQPEALAYRGWLLRLTGLQDTSKSASAELVAAGRSSIEQAIQADPGYGDAHLLLGLTLLEDSHQLQPAVAQFRLALADHASPPLVSGSRPILLQAFAAAHAPVPAGLGS